MSDAVDAWSRGDRALFAVVASFLIAGPLFPFVFPLPYFRPRPYLEVVFDNDDAAGRQSALDEFSGSKDC